MSGHRRVERLMRALAFLQATLLVVSLLAPVAVVSAISSTTTLFVFAFGVLLSWLAPTVAREDLSKINLLRKGVAAAIAATGVVLAS